MSRRLHFKYIWYIVICLIFSFTITGGASKGGQIFQTQLIVPPTEFKSFSFIASSDYERIRFDAILSKPDNTSMFNWFLLNTSAYQNYLHHQNYTSIKNQEGLRNDMYRFGYTSIGKNLPAGEYVFILEHVSGTKSMIIEIIIGLASSAEEMNALFNSIHPAPFYGTNLPPFFMIAVSTGGLLGILALKKVNKRMSKY